jgi:ribokinase
MECPAETVVHAIALANNLGLKVVCDPGGIEPNSEFEKPLKAGLFLIKPNEHEAEILTGIKVTDQISAAQAAHLLQSWNIENILITMGVNGAYLFTPQSEKHIPIPNVAKTNEKDETGCGDQTMAALAAGIIAGESLEEAVVEAVLAGTLQFHRAGIQPIAKEELAHAKSLNKV